MKRVGLITIYDNMNFGNRLQNYVLHHYLENELKCRKHLLGCLKEGIRYLQMSEFLIKMKYIGILRRISFELLL